MRLFFILVIYVLSINASTGQPGFSKWFDFDSGASFHNVVLKDDTLIIAGTTKDLATNQWGALFVKMDTLGNILNYKLHLDSMDGQYAFAKGYPFILTSDGGYLLAGKVFNRESYFIFKLDLNGDVIFFKEYFEPPNILTLQPQQILEIANGYLVFTSAQLQNGKRDVQISKINTIGEVLWEQFYGEYSKSETVGSIWMEDENTIVVGCSKEAGPSPGGPPLVSCFRNWIFAIDSLGSMKWEWAGEPCEGDIVKGLQRTPDEGWIYATRQPEFFDQWNWGAAPKFVKRDNNFNLLWERQVAESYSTDKSVFIDIKPTPEGDWAGLGSLVLPEPYLGFSNEYIYIPGCLYKFDNMGDSLWMRCDTVAIDNPTTEHQPGGMVVLPSGSIVAVGSFSEQMLGSSKEWAWVVKVDKHGCMEEPCIFTGIQDVSPEKNNVIRIYPNPAKEIVQVETKNKMTTIRLVNTQGKLLKEWKPMSGKTTIDISDLIGGIYFMEILSDKKREIRKIIKIE